MRDLEAEMRSVARGEKPAPPDARKPSFESVDALMRLLTPDNRRLLATIRDRRPQSIAELAEMSGRSAPNLTRTLAKLEAVGFVRMQNGSDRRKFPTAVVRRLHLLIDPFSQNDTYGSWAQNDPEAMLAAVVHAMSGKVISSSGDLIRRPILASRPPDSDRMSRANCQCA